MKTTTLITAAVASLLLTAGAATAQTQTRGNRADLDGDGRVSRAEFVQTRIQRLQAMDANRDGSLTVEERQAGRQARRAEAADRRFERLDADKNGQVSRAEFDAQRQQRAERARERGPRAHRVGRGQGRHMMRGAEARGPLVIAEAQARLEQRFDRLDANKDGFLTTEERRAHREQRQTRRGASPSAPASR